MESAAYLSALILVRRFSAAGVKVNVTAVLSAEQVETIALAWQMDRPQKKIRSEIRVIRVIRGL